MANLTAFRNTRQFGDTPVASLLRFPVAAGVNIRQGAMVAVGGPTHAVAGFLTPITIGATALSDERVVGRADRQYDNTSGLAGAIIAEPHQGVFDWDNGTAGDAITNANAGAACYAIDDHTVGLTTGGTTRPFAGVIQFVDPDTGRIWVEQRLSLRP